MEMKTDALRLHLSAYGTVWLLAFLLVTAGALIANLIFRVPFSSVADVLLAIAFFVLIVIAAGYLLGMIFGEEPMANKIVLCLGAALLFLPLVYAPVLAMKIYAFFGNLDLTASFIHEGFERVVKQTTTELVERAFGGRYLAPILKALQIGATVVGGIAAAAQLNQILRNRSGGAKA
jgi:hypothetical protein